jgi:hypothetical protein
MIMVYYTTEYDPAAALAAPTPTTPSSAGGAAASPSGSVPSAPPLGDAAAIFDV